MLIRGRLYAPEHCGHVVVAVEDGRIRSIESVAPDAPAPPGALGGPEATIGPGLIDLQVNGAFGQDFSDPSSDVARVSAGLTASGVTGYLACVITSPVERYGPCLDHLAAATAAAATPPARGAVGARLLGVHLEGPFLSPRRPGTHAPAWLLAPSADLADEWLARGPVRLLTLAPELPGALALIRRLVGHGVTVAIGHTDATWDEAAAAAAAGARLGTHLFNAMPPLHHRQPGAVGFLLASDLAVSVVADGHHIDLRMLELVGRLKTPDWLVVLTDALAGLGMPPGRFELAGDEIVSQGTAGRRLDGTLSGSLLPLDAAVGNLVRAGIAPEDAIRAATINPARVIGLDGTMGSVAAGRAADLVVFDADWKAAATVIGGRLAHRAGVEVIGEAVAR
jgi:N-acetylglucosamine-6-phosphate deacetylase